MQNLKTIDTVRERERERERESILSTETERRQVI